MSKGVLVVLPLYTPDMQVLVIGPSIGEAVNQPWIAVEREDNGLVLRKECVEIEVRQTMRMLARRLQFHEIHDVDDPDLQCRDVLSNNVHRC